LAENVQHAVQQAKAARKNVEERVLDVNALLTQDMKSFANSMLDWEYLDYVRRFPKTKKRMTPLDWLLNTDRQWVVAYLRAHLGDDFSNIIKAAYGRLPRALTPRMLKAFDTVSAMGPNKGSWGRHSIPPILHDGCCTVAAKGSGVSAAGIGCEKAPGMLDPRGPCPVLRVTVVSASPK
jgi:hypothetical protein